MADIDFTIDGHRYTMSWLSCKAAFELEAQLLKMAGGALRDAFRAASDADGDEMVLQTLTAAFASAFQNIDAQQMWTLATQLGLDARWINAEGIGVPLQHPFFDRHFATVQDLARLHRFVYEALKAQFAPFLAQLDTSGVIQRMLGSIRLRPTSTGGSGTSSPAASSASVPSKLDTTGL